jgi:hypothetical protein
MSGSRFARKNIADRSGGDPVAVGNYITLKDAAKGANLFYLLIAELSVPNVPMFRDHISDVVRVCAEKQMIWARAWRRIARVENVKFIRDRSEMNHPRKPMGQFVAGAVASSPDPAISLRQSRSPKEPTAVALNDSTPKAVENGYRKSLSEKIREITVGLHTSLSLLVCRVLGYCVSRGHLLFNNPEPVNQNN